MEKFVRQSLLFDFYGELLTEHQKSVYRDVIENDMSYTEAAEYYGISRQGVYDMIKRCDKLLEGYETKLRLMERFLASGKLAAEVKKDLLKLDETEDAGQRRKLLTKIMDALSAIEQGL